MRNDIPMFARKKWVRYLAGICSTILLILCNAIPMVTLARVGLSVLSSICLMYLLGTDLFMRFEKRKRQ